MSAEEKKTIKPQAVKISISNVNTMARRGKVENAIQEMNIDIIGINDMRWTGEGSIDKEDHIAFYSRSPDGKLEHRAGSQQRRISVDV